MLSLNNISTAQYAISQFGIRNPKELVARFIGHGIGFRPDIKVVDDKYHGIAGADRTTKAGRALYMRAYREHRRALGKD